MCNKDVNHLKDDTSLVNAKETIINIVSKHLQVVYPQVTSDSFQSNNKAHANAEIAAVHKISFTLFIVFNALISSNQLAHNTYQHSCAKCR